MTNALQTGWYLTRFDDESHVSPRGDIREHVLSDTCWCEPFYDEGVCVHNSLDEREKFELGMRKMS